MSAVVIIEPATQPVECPAQRGQANIALQCVLDAEIEALKARLRQGAADAGAACGPAGADRDCQVGWLRDSLAKLQARRDALS